jgi:hypothetical protein
MPAQKNPVDHLETLSMESQSQSMTTSRSLSLLYRNEV